MITRRLVNIVMAMLFSGGTWGYAQEPTGEEILRRIDANITAESRIVTSTMIIHGRRGSRSISAKSWIEGSQKAFTEYLAPPRERGTKMLKLNDQLWMYVPQSDRIIHISGHMLRQSLMGSDLSYEDMLEDPTLSNLYRAEVTGQEVYQGRDCWVVALTARKSNVAYHARKMWVDKERMIVLREDRYAKRGKLLKTVEVQEVFQVDGRWIPRRIIFQDVLSRGRGTEFIVDSLALNAPLPDYLFTKASLRK
ncbi:MAG: outer membrane lipoprotein-sorting protein [Fidelibacterota bacterium]